MLALLTALLGPALCVSAQSTVMIVSSDTGSGVTTVEIPVTVESEATFASGASGGVQLAVTGSSAKLPININTTISFRTPTSAIDGVESREPLPFGLLHNPVVGSLLEFAGSFPAGASVEIYSVDGRRVMAVAGCDGSPIDVASLRGGVYILKVNNHTLKFLKS